MDTEHLAKAMIANGISPSKAAKVLGVTPSYIKRICGVSDRAGAVPPFGKRRVGVVDVDDENEQAVVKTIMAMKNSGMSVRDIADQLNADGVASRGSRWHKTTVHRVISRYG